MSQTQVWIEEGCITCNACEETCEPVFDVLEDTCVIKPAVDYKAFNEDIVDAADGCPVDVIKYILDNGATNTSGDTPADSSSGAAEVEAVVLEHIETDALELPVIEVSVRVFRYDPAEAVQGWDTFACQLPGHLSVLEALAELRQQDVSLAFRQGAADDPTTAIRVNGAPALPGRVRLVDATRVRGNQRVLVVAPLEGRDVLRDLVVDLSTWEHERRLIGPWVNQSTRATASTAAARAGFPLADADAATALHLVTEAPSPHVVDGMSDATAHAPEYMGPALATLLWSRAADERTAPADAERLRRLLDAERSGVFAEADLSSFNRHGTLGQRTATTLAEARHALVSPSVLLGTRHDRHVWWFSWTVKNSGTLNETFLAAGTLGPFGSIGNVGPLLRMMTGFTRTGRKMFWDLQGLFLMLPGKAPPAFNKRVQRHHEVVQLFNTYEKRV